MGRTSTTEEFIKKAKSIHGNKYDYSDVNYINNKTKINILCKIHRYFMQTPHGHLYGNKCPKCMKNYKYDINKFIFKANKIHNNKYDYLEVDYIKSTLKIKIKCKFHGLFNQTANNHLAGNGYCVL